jgi:glycosyl transferase family 87
MHAGVLNILRTGEWLTRERVRRIAVALICAYAVAVGYLVVTANGAVDQSGRPLGTDFSNVYAAGTYVLEGRPQAPFDPALQYAREQAIFGPDTPFYGWHYPPFFLFVAAGLALLPYGLALAVWQIATFLLYLVSIRAILAVTPISGLAATPISGGANGEHRAVPTLALLLAAAFPAVFVNLSHGHNGFLSAALMGLALVTLDRRPIGAGVLFGLLIYKPQFGLMVPFVLAATARWRTFAVAAATAILLVLLATLAFGPQVWEAFAASTQFTRAVVLEIGDPGWHKIQSTFSWVRMWGGSIALAYLLQAAVSLAVGATLIWLWRSAASFALKASALCLSAMLASPYGYDYDMMILAPAIAFLACDGWARGWRPWEKTLLAALWLMPIAARGITLATFIPLGVIAMIAVYVAILRRGTLDLSKQVQMPATALR